MLDRLNAIKFVMLVSFVSSLVLALLYSTLINRVEENIRLDKKQSILRVIGINSSNLSSEEVNLKYEEHINEFVINTDGEIVDIPLSEIVWKENKSTGMTDYLYSKNMVQYLPLYQSINPNGYIIPISGKGLWSTLKGYFAISEDKNTSLGIVFYSHKETPGLGGEVDKVWFQDQFKIDKGKKIFNKDGALVSIIVNNRKNTDGKIHEVDGITGATVTSNGVTKFLKRDLDRYKNFLIGQE